MDEFVGKDGLKSHSSGGRAAIRLHTLASCDSKILNMQNLCSAM